MGQATPAFSEAFFEALLKGKQYEKQGLYVERFFEEAEPLVVKPFISKLRARNVAARRKILLLRHLRSFSFPELLALCRDWIEHSNEELASLAGEILASRFLKTTTWENTQ